MPDTTTDCSTAVELDLDDLHPLITTWLFQTRAGQAIFCAHQDTASARRDIMRRLRFGHSKFTLIQRDDRLVFEILPAETTRSAAP